MLGVCVGRRWFERGMRPRGVASSVSGTSDYSVGITFEIRGQTADILNVVRVQLEFPELRRRVLREAARFGAGIVPIEESASGIALRQDLNRIRRQQRERREAPARPRTRSTWYERNRGGLNSTQAMLARYAGQLLW